MKISTLSIKTKPITNSAICQPNEKPQGLSCIPQESKPQSTSKNNIPNNTSTSSKQSPVLPWEISSLLCVNRLFPELQKIISIGQIDIIRNYQIFSTYRRSCTLSSLYYCQAINSNDSLLNEDINSQTLHIDKLHSSQSLKLNDQVDGKLISQLKYLIPKVIRFLPKTYQKLPIEGVHNSDYLRKTAESSEFKENSVAMLVRYFECFEDNEYLYIVSEQYESDLKEYLMKKFKNKNISEQIVLELVFQILIGMMYISEHFQIIQSLKLSSILIERTSNATTTPFLSKEMISNEQLNVKLPLFSYSTYNIPLQSMPCFSLKYLAPEIIRSNYKITPHLKQTAWTLGVLTIDIIMKGQELGPFDVLGKNEKELSSKAQKQLITQRILQFDFGKYVMQNSNIFSSFSEEFIELLGGLLQQNVASRLDLNDVRLNILFANSVSDNQFYNGKRTLVEFKDQSKPHRVPFSMKELVFK